MKKGSTFFVNYFLDGFFLANKRSDLILWSALIGIPNAIRAYMPPTLLTGIGSLLITLLSFISIFLNFGLMFSLPYLLSRKHMGKTVEPRQVWREILHNTKRIILPGLLLFILVPVIVVLLMAYAASSYHVSENQLRALLQSLSVGWSPIISIFIFVLSPFIYTSMYFSLERRGLLFSLWKSVMTSLKHLKFTGFVAIVSVILYFLTCFIPIVNPWMFAVRTLVNLYIQMIITAGVLLYYQKIVRK